MKLVDLDMLPAGRVDREAVDELPEIKILFVCDGRACGIDCESNMYVCKKTSDPAHAANFTLIEGTYVERG